MTVLPWDRFTPDEPTVTVPVLPPAPPTSVPLPAPAAPPPSPSAVPQKIDVTAVIATTIKETLQQVLPTLKDQAIGYAQTVGQATGRGQQVDHAHPTITATTSTGKELVIADAKSRSWRTFLQGLTIDLLAALAAILLTITQADPPLDKTAWIGVGALAIKTLIQTALAYLMRLRVTPTIKTDTGAKMAVMPAPRPLVASDRLTRRSNPDAELAPLFGG